MADKTEYEPVDTGEGKMKVRQTGDTFASSFSVILDYRLRRWRRRRLWV